METEQATQPTPTMKSYDIPVFEGLSADEAKLLRNKVYADVNGDNFHPYKYRGHPQNKEMRAAIKKSFDITAGKPPTTEICDDAIAAGIKRKADQKAKRISNIEAKVARLKELGFISGGNPIPDDPQDYHENCLDMQILKGEGKYNELSSMMQTEMRKLKPSLAMNKLFEQYATISEKDYGMLEYKARAAENLIEWIYAKNQEREESLAKKTRKIERPNQHLPSNLRKTARSDWVL